MSRRKKVMKAKRFFLMGFLILAAASIIFTSCKYDVAEPLWDQPFTAPATPRITQVTPSAALAGINTIKITGENFIGTKDTCIVYFDNLIADVLSMSPTSIVVRRPNLVKDSSTIKVVPQKALVVAKHGPYKIESVLSKYGSFLDNLQLSVLVTDQSENLYVGEVNTRYVYKITSKGEKSILATSSRSATDARIGPGNRLILLGNNRAVDQVDLASGTVSRWTQLPSGKAVRFGDFDANGYFYTAGVRTDLCIVPPNPPTSLTLSQIQLSNVYADDEIFAIRAFNNYLYVASKPSPGVETDAIKIFKHKIEANGVLGAQQLVLDLSKWKAYSALVIKGITLANDGVLYLAVDSPNSMLVYDPASNNLDLFYKGILPEYCKHFVWGSGNYLYMIVGDAAAAKEWNVYKVNMGRAGAK